MKLEEYKAIIDFINCRQSKCSRTVLSDLIKKFHDSFQYHTLTSIFLTDLQKKVKTTYHTKTQDDQIKYYYERYKRNMKTLHYHVSEGKENNTSNVHCKCFLVERRDNVLKEAKLQTLSISEKALPKICDFQQNNSPNDPTRPVIIEIAIDNGLPPFLMARLIVEQYHIEQQHIKYEAELQETKCDSKSTSKANKHCTDISSKVPCEDFITAGSTSDLVREKLLAVKDHNPVGERKFCTDNHNSNETNGELKQKNSETNIQTHLKQLVLTEASGETKMPLHKSEGLVFKNGAKSEEMMKNSDKKTEVRNETVECRAKLASNEIREGKNEKKKPEMLKKQVEEMNSQSLKNKLSSVMKNPDLIEDSFLREQVLQCMSYDVCYGPINDAIRHSVGLEYEEKLLANVKLQKLPFLDENDLRKRGYDKTPDVKLEIPIAVNGSPVCWIESKASFGDLDSHLQYLRAQYHSYWNRFGPGLVIYWFGFIDTISSEMRKQGILIMDRFPSSTEITFMDH